MVRPPKRTTRYFQRTLGVEELQILIAAGNGNISDGFRELMDVYSHVWSLGFRPIMPLSSIEVALSIDDVIQGNQEDSSED